MKYVQIAFFTTGAQIVTPYPRTPSDPKNLIFLWDQPGTQWVLLAKFQPDRPTPAEAAVEQTNKRTNERTNRESSGQSNRITTVSLTA